MYGTSNIFSSKGNIYYSYSSYAYIIRCKSSHINLQWPFKLQKKKAGAKSEMSCQSNDSKAGVSDIKSNEGELGSTTISTVYISGDEGDDGHQMRDDDNVDSSDDDISSLEGQLRKIDLSLEKLQIEYQRDADIPGKGR